MKRRSFLQLAGGTCTSALLGSKTLLAGDRSKHLNRQRLGKWRARSVVRLDAYRVRANTKRCRVIAAQAGAADVETGIVHVSSTSNKREGVRIACVNVHCIQHAKHCIQTGIHPDIVAGQGYVCGA